MVMRTYNLKPLKALEGLSKEEAFNGYEESFDWALPQPWLDKFAEWCELSDANCIKEVTYRTILSTTVWSYKKERDVFGRPTTCCREVAQAYLDFEVENLGRRSVIEICLSFHDWKMYVYNNSYRIQCPKNGISLPITSTEASYAQDILNAMVEEV